MMEKNLRQQREALEEKILSPFAQKSAFSRGRKKEEECCNIRTDFQRDRDRIIHCKAFRRMKYKTQVFISPQGDHYRTRLTHTLEVSQIARTISRALSLNEDLTEAIALGHDLGHTPFGHAGEKALNRIHIGGFHHNQQSIRVVEYLEKEGRGLNLTWEVLDGILNHRTSGKPATMEAMVVQLSDKIAYINHDIDDAVRAGILTPKEIPSEFSAELGETFTTRINAMVQDTIENSWQKQYIAMSDEMKKTMTELRKYMFAKVYYSDMAEKDHEKAEKIVLSLYSYYLEHPQQMNTEFYQLIEAGETREQSVCDYIACMTDRFAVTKFSQLFIPQPWGIY